MGADWIGAYVPLKKNREQALAALAALSDEQVLELIDSKSITTDYWEVEDGEFDMDTFRTDAVKAVNDCYDAASGYSRDGSGWDIEGVLYAVSGGLSWGDAPTDLCESIWLVGDLEVTQ